jgi:hypothetical protein
MLDKEADKAAQGNRLAPTLNARSGCPHPNQPCTSAWPNWIFSKVYPDWTDFAAVLYTGSSASDNQRVGTSNSHIIEKILFWIFCHLFPLHSF